MGPRGMKPWLHIGIGTEKKTVRRRDVQGGRESHINEQGPEVGGIPEDKKIDGNRVGYQKRIRTRQGS